MVHDANLILQNYADQHHLSAVHRGLLILFICSII